MSEFMWVKAAATGRRGVKNMSTLAISMSSKPSGRQFSLVLYQKGLKMTRWIKGDKVSIGFDPASGVVGVRRDPRGFMLTNNGGPGNTNSLRVTCKPPESVAIFPHTVMGDGDAQMVEDVLVIAMPKAIAA